MKFFVKNENFGQKRKFWLTMNILVKHGNFCEK